jgi:cytochrome c oxidase cbb3-type subunit III
MFSRFLNPALSLGLALSVVGLLGCQREKRELRPDPALTRVAVFDAGKRNPYDGNAYAISEGQRLFTWYNCSGCHANGGGGMGPPLIKEDWLYGDHPANLFDTIAKGRPNGMPAWADKISEYQIWQLIAYIQSLNGRQPRAAVPVRLDSITINPQTLRPGPEVPPK